MKKAMPQAAVGKSLEDLGKILTENYTIINNLDYDVTRHPQIEAHAPNVERPMDTEFMSMDGQGHDANQSADLKTATRTNYEFMMLDFFIDLVQDNGWCDEIDILKERME